MRTGPGTAVEAAGSHALVTRDEIDVSVLVPANDEAVNLPLFMEQAAEAFAESTTRYEVIVIDDGSTDGTWEVLERLRETYPFLRAERHRSRRGIADALRTGYLASRGRVLVFYPADLQFKPEDIPRLASPILADEADMVTGYKQGKYDKAFVSGIYNRLSRTLFHVPVRDLNSVKAYRREIMDDLPIRPDWHRYMIVLAAAQGYTVSEIPIALYPRHAGKSKFGIGRIPWASWTCSPSGSSCALDGSRCCSLTCSAPRCSRSARWPASAPLEPYSSRGRESAPSGR